MQFDEQSIRRIIRSVLDSEKRNQSTPIGGRRRRGMAASAAREMRVGKLSRSIGAFDGSHPVNGYVTIWELVAGTPATWAATGDGVPVFSIVPYAISAGDIVLIMKDENQSLNVTYEEWLIVLSIGASEEIDIITDFQVDGTNMKFQMKTRKVRVVPSEDETGWIDIHTGTSC